MKASDISPVSARPEIVVDAKLMDRNAESAGRSVNWRRTHIASTRGACESRPYGRDQAVAGYDRRKRLHKLLDRALSDVGYAQDSAEVKTLHDMLDQALDEEERKAELHGEESESEEEEEDDGDDWPGVQEEREHDSGRRRVSSKDSRSRARSYVTDADFISRYLPPNLLCSEVANALDARAYAAQKDDAMRGFWTGLIYFLGSQPKGTRIRDCRQPTLSTLISKTLAQ